MQCIYLLIGPKGSGKTYIGTLLESRTGIPFVRVEDIALRVQRDRAYDDRRYVHEVFGAIEAAIRDRLRTVPELVFESTGLTDAFDAMLRNLQASFRVVLIRIAADPGNCARRVQHRDLSQHVNVSDAQVRAINAQATAKPFSFDGVIANDDASPEAILDAFARLREAALSPPPAT
ncbi:MAG: AAA family ATPase [Cytophagales bacterium]|nr:AAA family ATPase [Cytophagales bacterium]